DPGSGLPVRSRRRDVASARSHRGVDRGGARTAERGHTGGGGVLQEDHGGPRSAAGDRMTARLKSVLTPLAVAVLLVVLWELFVNWRDIKPFLLPKPSAIWDALTDNKDQIWSAARETGTNALVGIVIGTVLG